MKPFKRLSNRKGQAMVEFAMTTLFLLGFVLVLASAWRICMNWTSLQFAVNEASRFGILGKTDPNQPTREASIRQRIEDAATNLGVNTPITVTFYNIDGTPTAIAGNPANFVRVQAATEIMVDPLTGILLDMFGDYSNSNLRIVADTLVRNEPF